MNRAGTVLLSTSFAAGLALGCVERPLDLPADDNEEMPACLAVGGYGHWDDGQAHALINEDGNTSTICMCMTSDELQELGVLGEMQTFIDSEINQLAYEECTRVSALYDFDSDPCLEYYETGGWRGWLTFTDTEDTAWKNREGLTCGDDFEGDELGCTVGGRQGSLGWLALVIGLFSLRRRRPGQDTRLRRRGPGRRSGPTDSSPLRVPRAPR